VEKLNGGSGIVNRYSIAQSAENDDPGVIVETIFEYGNLRAKGTSVVRVVKVTYYGSIKTLVPGVLKAGTVVTIVT
jgi:hypothetical protein